MDVAKNTLDSIISNQYSRVAIKFFLMYSSFARPEIPDMMKSLFEHSIFRILVLFLVAYMTSKDIMVSLAMSLAFYFLFEHVNKMEEKTEKRTE